MIIRVFVDDEDVPRAEFEPPGNLELDTIGLADGPHTLVVRAGIGEEDEGVERIPFTVRNGPGIAVVGISEDEVVAGRIPILVNAFQNRAGDDFEPVSAETPAPIPTWAWVLCLVVGIWATYYTASEFRGHASELAAEAPGAAAAVETGVATVPSAVRVVVPSAGALGEQIYGNYCSACHQLGGAGLAGVFPPLKGDAVVTAESSREHVAVVLNGLSGKSIDGVAYMAEMPGFAEQLTNAEVAAVVNHERTAWGNAAPLTTTSEVASIRDNASQPDSP